MFLGLVSSYTAPSYNSINFTLCSSYTPPLYNSINFTLEAADTCGVSSLITINLNSPIDNYNSSSNSISFNGSVSSGTTLTNVSVWSNISGSWAINQTNTSGINNTNYLFTIAGIVDGTYKWGYQACDNTGYCSFSSNRTFNIDTTPPQVQFISPTTSAGNHSQNYIQANLSFSDSHLQNGTIYLYNSTSIVQQNTSTTSPLFINFTSLSDGDYYLNGTSYDTFGNKNQTTTYHILLDTTPPAMSYNPTTETNLSILNRNYSLVNISASDTHLSSVILNWNGTNESFQTNVGSNYWSNKTGLADGNYTFYAWANDTIGNYQFLGVRTITIDKTIPFIQFVSPFSSGNYSRNYIESNVSSSDTNYKNLTLYLYNSTSLVQTNSTTSTYLFVNYTNLPDGYYYTNATSYDLAGNKNSTSTNTILLDLTFPQVQFIYPTTSAGNYSQNYIQANLSFSDSHLQNGTIYLYNSTSIVQQNTSTTSPLFVNFTNLPDGDYYLNGTSYDTFGNKNQTTTYHILLDTISPTITMSYPTNITYNVNVTHLDYSASDINLAKCWYSTDGGTTNSSSSSCGSTFTGINTSDGFHHWLVYANDTSGNIGSANIYFTQDTTSPNTYLISPANNTNTTNLTQTFTANETDNLGLKNAILYIWNSTGSQLYHNWCYQESANTSNQTGIDGNCGLNYSGSYSNNTDVNNITHTSWWYDGNWNTLTASGSAFYVNYSKPVGVSSIGNIWQYKDGTARYNVTIPSSCMSFDNNILMLEHDYSTTPSHGAGCWNGTTWILMGVQSNNGYMYEEAMWWNIGTSISGTSNQTSWNYTFSSPGTYLWNVNTCDQAGNCAFNSTNYTITIPSSNINITLNSPVDNYNSSISSLSTNATVISKSIYSITNVSIFTNISGSWSANQTNTSGINNTNYLFTMNNIPDGVYKWGYRACDSLGTCTFSDNRTITIDTTPPTWTVIPANDTITYPTIWNGEQFTATDLHLSSYSINDSRFTINSTGYLNATGILAVGSYPINVSVNDTFGNYNFTIYLLTINKSNSQCLVLFNATSPLTYPTNVFTSYSNCDSTFTLYRNGSTITNNSAQDLSVGYYNFTVMRTDTQNYTNVLDTQFFTINKGTLVGNLTSSHSGAFTYTYNNIPTSVGYVNISTKGVGDVNYIVYRDSVSKGIGETVNLAAGSYNYVLNSTGGVNWSSSSSIDSKTLTINKATPVGNITGTTPIIYGTSADILGAENNSVDGDLTYTLYRNNSLVSNPDNTILGAGLYHYVYNTSGGINFTSNSSLATFDLTVNKNASICGIFLNTSNTITYGDTVNVQTNCSTSYNMYLNGSSILNNTNYFLGAGYYNFSVFRIDTQNYTNTYSEVLLTVNKATPTLNYYLNGVSNNLTISYPSQVNASANVNAGTVHIYRNGTDITSSNNQFISLSAGYYEYGFNSTGNQNYSDISTKYLYATINKNSEIMYILFNETSPLEYPKTFTVWSNASTSFNLYRNGTSITNNSVQSLYVGVWNFTVVRNDNINYSNITTIRFFTVQDTIPPSITFQSKYPVDLNETYQGNIIINYTITDSGVGVNASSAFLYYKVNSTNRSYWLLINGTPYYNYYITNSMTNISSNFSSSLDDHQIFQGDYNFPQTQMQITPRQIYNLSSNSDFLSMQLFNVSNNTPNNFMMINASRLSGVDLLRIYYCNSNYSFSSNVKTSSYCTEFASLNTSSYNYQEIPINLNNNTGTINGVPVTSTSYFAFQGATSTVWGISYITNVSRTDAYKYSSNNGNSWTNQALTLDTHIHQFDGDALYYYACVSDLSNNTACTSPLFQDFNIGIVKPTTPVVTVPTNITYEFNKNINITWIQSVSYNGYPITYNISLLNSDTTFNRTINSSNINTYQIFNATDIGSFRILVNASDGAGDFAYDFSPVFAVAKAPIVYLNSPVNNSLKNNLTQIFSVNHTDTVGLVNSTIYLWYSNGTLLYSNTQNISGFSNQTSWNYTFPIDNTYIWNVLDYSSSNLFAFNSTNYTFTIDSTYPNTYLISPVNNTYYNTRGIINFTINQTDNRNLSNSSLYIWDNSGNLININTTNITGTTNQTNISYTFSNDGLYYFNSKTCDEANNCQFNSTNKSIIIDTITPLIDWGSNVATNNSGFSQNYVFANVSYTETNPVNLTFQIWNTTGTWNTTTYNLTSNNSWQSINWTNLVDGNYQYNATITDNVGHSNTTTIRFISIETSSPSITINSPTLTGTNQTNNFTTTYNATVSDLVNLTNVSLTINGIVNQTVNTAVNSVTQIFTYQIGGIYVFFDWGIKACNFVGLCSSSGGRTFYGYNYNFSQVNGFNWSSVNVTSYYKLNEFSGTVVVDSKNNTNMTNSNVIITQPGIIGPAYYFNSTSGSSQIYMNSGYPSATSGSTTIGFWFKTNGSNANNYLYSKVLDKSQQHYYGCKFDASNKISCGIFTGAGNQFTLSNLSYADDNFHYLLFQFGSSGQYMYIDGKLENSNPTYTVVAVDGPYDYPTTYCSLVFGSGPSFSGYTCYSPTSFFKGYMNNIIIMNRSVSLQDSIQLYNNGSALPYNFSLINYTSNEPTNNSVHSYSVNFNVYLNSTNSVSNLSLVIYNSSNAVVSTTTNSSGFNNVNYTFNYFAKDDNYTAYYRGCDIYSQCSYSNPVYFRIVTNDFSPQCSNNVSAGLITCANNSYTGSYMDTNESILFYNATLTSTSSQQIRINSSSSGYVNFTKSIFIMGGANPTTNQVNFYLYANTSLINQSYINISNIQSSNNYGMECYFTVTNLSFVDSSLICNGNTQSASGPVPAKHDGVISVLNFNNQNTNFIGNNVIEANGGSGTTSCDPGPAWNTAVGARSQVTLNGNYTGTFTLSMNGGGASTCNNAIAASYGGQGGDSLLTISGNVNASPTIFKSAGPGSTGTVAPIPPNPGSGTSKFTSSGQYLILNNGNVTGNGALSNGGVDITTNELTLNNFIFQTNTTTPTNLTLSNDISRAGFFGNSLISQPLSTIYSGSFEKIIVGNVTSYLNLGSIGYELRNLSYYYGPLTKFTSPLNNSVVGLNTNFNISAIDSYGLKNTTVYIWYSNGTLLTTNSTNFTGVGNTTTLTNYFNETGLYLVNLLTYNVNNTSNNFWNKNLTINVTKLPPTITSLSPANNTYSNIGDWIFSGFASDNVALANMSLFFNGALNQFNLSGINNVNYYFTINNIIQGIYTWYFKACNIFGICSTSDVQTLNIDTTPPTITLSTPVNNTQSFNTTQVFSVNLTDNFNLSNVTLQIWDSNNKSILVDPLNDSWVSFSHDINHTGYQDETLDVQHFIQKWNFSGNGTGSPTGWTIVAPIVYGGVVYAGSNDGNLYAINASTGVQIWNKNFPASIFSSPNYYDGVIYVEGGLSNSDTLYAVNPSNGNVIWSKSIGDSASSVSASVRGHAAPEIYNGVIYIGSRYLSANNYIYAINSTNGNTIWSYATSNTNPILTSSTYNNGLVYTSSSDGNLYTIYSSNGTLAWKYTTGGQIISSPAYYKDMIFVGSNDGGLYEINATNGSLIVVYATSNSIQSSPIVYNDVLYFGNANGIVYAVNVTTKTSIWSFTTGNSIFSAPSLSNGILFVSSLDNYIYALNLTTGSDVWHYLLGTAGYYTNPVINNGYVYVGAKDNILYQFGSSVNTTYITTTNQISGLSNSTSWSYLFTSYGNYKWNAVGMDKAGNSVTNTNNYTILIKPLVSVTLNTPTNNLYSNSSTYLFNASVDSQNNMSNLNLYIWDSNNAIVNQYTGTCYQQSAYITNQTGTDNSCNLNYNGGYVINGYWLNSNYMYDGSFSTFGYMGGYLNNNYTGNFYSTFYKPSGSVNTSLFTIKATNPTSSSIVSGSTSTLAANGTWGAPLLNPTANISIPSSCWNYSPDYVKFNVYTYNNYSSGSNFNTGLTVECYDGTWKAISNTSCLESTSIGACTDLFEEGMNWNLSNTQYQTSVTGTSNSSQWSYTFTNDDTYHWNVLGTDNSSNSYFALSNNTLYVNTLGPTINILSPTSNYYANYSNITLNYTVTDSSPLNTTWYSIINSNGTTIISNTTLTGNTTFTLSDISDTYKITVCSKDYAYNTKCTSLNFGVLLNAPVITLLTPTNAQQFGSGSGISFLFTATSSLATTLDTCKFYNDFNGTWQNTDTFSNLGGNYYQNLLSKNINDYNTHYWNVWCNDSVGRSSYGLTNFSVSVTNPSPVIVSPAGPSGQNIISNISRWSMTTDVGTTSYSDYFAKDTQILHGLFLSNLGTEPYIINISCSNVNDGNLCNYVTLSNTTLVLPVGQNIKTRIQYTIDLPSTFNKTSESFNIIGTDTDKFSQVVTQTIYGPTLVSSTLDKIANKAAQTNLWGLLKTKITLSYLLIFFVLWFFISVILYYSLYRYVLKKNGKVSPYAVGLAIISGLVISLVIIYFM